MPWRRCLAERLRSPRIGFQTFQRGLLSPNALCPLGSLGSWPSLWLSPDPRRVASPRLPGAAQCCSGVQGAFPPRPPTLPCSPWKSARSGALRQLGSSGERVRTPSSEGAGSLSQILPVGGRSPPPGGARGGRAASECAGVGVWSEPTCISIHVLSTRGCSSSHTAAPGHRDAGPWREVSCVVV